MSQLIPPKKSTDHLSLLGVLHDELALHVDKHCATRHVDPQFRELWNGRLQILKGASTQVAKMRYLSYWLELESIMAKMLNQDDTISIVFIEMRINLAGDRCGYIQLVPKMAAP